MKKTTPLNNQLKLAKDLGYLESNIKDIKTIYAVANKIVASVLQAVDAEKMMLNDPRYKKQRLLEAVISELESRV